VGVGGCDVWVRVFVYCFAIYDKRGSWCDAGQGCGKGPVPAGGEDNFL
jgi:hypothetical protein